jgi:hypothetical protein
VDDKKRRDNKKRREGAVSCHTNIEKKRKVGMGGREI